MPEQSVDIDMLIVHPPPPPPSPKQLDVLSSYIKGASSRKSCKKVAITLQFTFKRLSHVNMLDLQQQQQKM